MANEIIRETAKSSGIPHWKIAEAIGTSEFTFCRKLRRELTPAETERILTAIYELKEGQHVRNNK